MPRNPELTSYLNRFAGQDEVLAQVARETSELPNAGMQSRADQAALLTLLTKLLDARVAVEVGTFTGYGAICIARGLPADGHLTCLEVDPHYAEIARRNLDAAGVGRTLDWMVWVDMRRACAPRARRPIRPAVAPDIACV